MIVTIKVSNRKREIQDGSLWTSQSYISACTQVKSNTIRTIIPIYILDPMRIKAMSYNQPRKKPEAENPTQLIELQTSITYISVFSSFHLTSFHNMAVASVAEPGQEDKRPICMRPQWYRWLWHPMWLNVHQAMVRVWDHSVDSYLFWGGLGFLWWLAGNPDYRRMRHRCTGRVDI